MKISLISPSRNNLKYLKWSYASVRKNASEYDIEYCVADDFSDDGTWEWCQEMMKKDKNFKAIRNEGPTRLGHTILYDTLINEVATGDIVGIWHADMYMAPGAIPAVITHMYSAVPDEKHVGLTKFERNWGTVVSLTRIEPPLHPPGPEKVIYDCGLEVEDFEEERFIGHVESLIRRYQDKTTEGIFAPWFIFKDDFTSIGGHDEGFYPQSKEDSDIFNRFILNGYKIKQVWNGFCYHMTCRGNRRNPNQTDIRKDNPEWLEHNVRSTRNFIRKWGHMVKHDALMKPIIPHKYDIGFQVRKCTLNLLANLEPWCRTIDVDLSMADIELYRRQEQVNTKFADLTYKVDKLEHMNSINDITVEIDGSTFNDTDFQIIQQLPDIIKDSGEIGTFMIGNLKITIKSMNTYEKELIKVENTGWRRANHK